MDVPQIPDGLVAAEGAQLTAQPVERTRDARAVALDELLRIDREVAPGTSAVGDEDQILLAQPSQDLVDLRAGHSRAARQLVAGRGMSLHEREVELGLVV